jgi:hypothetical protein
MSLHRLVSRSRAPGVGPSILRIGFFASALLFLMADDGIGPDEFQCEVAVSHLVDCCPALPSDLLSCAHGGCESNLTPDLQIERAVCIQQKTCEELVTLGVCDVANWEPVMSPSCPAPCSAKVPPCH